MAAGTSRQPAADPSAALESTASLAQDLSHSYIEADYVSFDIDGIDEVDDFFEDIDDGSGYGVRLSFGGMDSR